jgi:hypothetical protein
LAIKPRKGLFVFGKTLKGLSQKGEEMTQEKVGDKVESKVESKEETLSPQEETAALRQQLKDAEEKASKWEKEAQAHQKVVSKKDQELQEVRRKADSIDEIMNRLELQEAYLAELGGKNDGKSFIEKAQAAQKQRQYKALVDKGNETSAKIDELIKDSGLTKNSPELETAKMYFERAGITGNTSDYDLAVKKVEEVVSKTPKEEKPKESEEERVERLANERLKAKMIENKMLTPEGGEPSAPGGTVTVSRSELAKMPVKERQELLRTKDVIIKD